MATQLASLLSGAARASTALSDAAGNATRDLGPQLAEVEKNLMALAGNVSRDLERGLEQLRPPPEVLEGVVRPVAAALDSALGGAAQLLVSGPNVTAGLGGVLEQLESVARQIFGDADALLGGLLGGGAPPDPLAGLQGLLAGIGRPGASDSEAQPGTVDDSASEDGARPSTADVSDQRPDESDDSSNRPPNTSTATAGSQRNTTRSLPGTHGGRRNSTSGRGLLAVAWQDAGARASDFDVAAFRGRLGASLADMVASFANDLVGSVLGLQGVSLSDGITSIMGNLASSLLSALTGLRSAAAELPQGPILSVIMGGSNRTALDGLELLSTGLSAALRGDADAPTVDTLSALLGQAGPVLNALGTSRGGLLAAGPVAAAEQLATRFGTVSEAAGGMLGRLQARLARLVPGPAP